MSALQAAGGFTPPLVLVVPDGAVDQVRLVRLSESLPGFMATRGGVSFEDPAERWAREREREMRALTRMWDWP